MKTVGILGFGILLVALFFFFSTPAAAEEAKVCFVGFLNVEILIYNEMSCVD